MTQVSYSWARAHWGEMLRRISQDNEKFIITLRGKPVAAFSPVPRDNLPASEITPGGLT